MKFIITAVMIVTAFSTHAEIRQELGIDPSVDYASLAEMGPWDDRNYQLTKEDLDVLPDNDQYLRNVPVFFKVWARRDNPNIGKYYPRELYQSFLIHHGGLIVDGHWYKEGLGLYHHPDGLDGKPDPNFRGGQVNPDLETVLTAGAESTIEFNPDNNMQAVAGVNANGGQSMYYSTDGGQTWSFSQVNPSSCCDPTVDWSTTDVVPQRVYQADLASCTSGCDIRASYSTDGGATWATMIEIDGDNQNDKEFIHVDRSPTSPHKDNVYITYHKNNVMQFARSTDFGETWSTPVGLNTNDRGIGSDITTDSAGNIYYIYPSVSGAGLISMKSTDGGLNWQSPVQITPLRGDFDFPIPAMETREVFIYAAADVDSSNNIIVAITDETADSAGGGQTNPNNNRGEIRVFKSTDGGANWTELDKPHADDGQLNSGNPIDRFHPWMMIGENDAIHVGFYDTRNSTNRTGVDFYYNVSLDGGATWLPQGEQRFSTQTSTNISGGFEWGDYNGLSVVGDKIAMIWTDHRGSPTNAMVGTDVNQFGQPSFNMTATPSSIDVCANDTNVEVEIGLTPTQNYQGVITLSEDDTPNYVINGSFSPNGQMAPFNATYGFDVNNNGLSGTETVTIQGSGNDLGDITLKTVDFTINYADTAAAPSALTDPLDAATNVPLQPSFSWSADPNSTDYLIEVATDSGFNNVIISEQLDTNSYDVTTDLDSSTEYFWRITTLNGCGNAVSSTSSFTTLALPGDCSVGQQQITFFEYTFSSPDDIIFEHDLDTPVGVVGGLPETQGWTVSTDAGDANWALEQVGFNGSYAWQANDLPTTNDTSVVSPVMSLPSGSGPLTLRFWNEQSLESRNATSCWDAGQLLKSVNGGGFTQVTDADIINDDYTGNINAGPASGEPGWCGDPLSATVFNVDVNADAGNDVQFAFRISSDTSVGRPDGWVIDNVRVTGCQAPD
ncbi:hypothetical protein ACFODZ_04020 [Marinicella sediminis]|uniref:Fibronectin type-III domain-containing protein n=1 Tax=Marinicella sediminis TaxID=1792834 RepID=A0ABV7JDB8_9GAMM|nr:sialidase family protein [Marinicella sediminis]